MSNLSRYKSYERQTFREYGHMLRIYNPRPSPAKIFGWGTVAKMVKIPVI